MSPSSSLAQTRNKSAMGAFVIQFLDPLRMYLPPWSRARVSILLVRGTSQRQQRKLAS